MRKLMDDRNTSTAEISSNKCGQCVVKKPIMSLAIGCIFIPFFRWRLSLDYFPYRTKNTLLPICAKSPACTMPASIRLSLIGVPLALPRFFIDNGALNQCLIIEIRMWRHSSTPLRLIWNPVQFQEPIFLP
jgi:hypothetical protein